LAKEFKWRSRTSLVDNGVIVFSLSVAPTLGYLIDLVATEPKLSTRGTILARK
jgi:hypothetical protein